MNVQHDPDTILAAWLDEGPDRLPESTRRAIVVNARTTHQTRRRFWLPWRNQTMNGLSRFALTAVAVVAVALGGLYLFNSAPGSGIGGQPSPTPSLTPMPFPAGTGGTPVAAGTYALELPARTTAGTETTVRITFTVTSGWQKNITPTTLWRSTTSERFGFFTVDNVTVDPCPSTGNGLLDPPLGPTVEDLVTSLPRHVDMTFGASSDTTIAGFTGTQLEVTAPAVLKCPDQYEAVWTAPQGAPFEDGGHAMAAREKGRLVIIDADGVRLAIALAYDADTSADDLAELQAILDSVQVELLPTPSAPSPSSS